MGEARDKLLSIKKILVTKIVLSHDTEKEFVGYLFEPLVLRYQQIFNYYIFFHENFSRSCLIL